MAPFGPSLCGEPDRFRYTGRNPYRPASCAKDDRGHDTCQLVRHVEMLPAATDSLIHIMSRIAACFIAPMAFKAMTLQSAEASERISTRGRSRLKSCNSCRAPKPFGLSLCALLPTRTPHVVDIRFGRHYPRPTRKHTPTRMHDMGGRGAPPGPAPRSTVPHAAQEQGSQSAASACPGPSAWRGRRAEATTRDHLHVRHTQTEVGVDRNVLGPPPSQARRGARPNATGVKRFDTSLHSSRRFASSFAIWDHTRAHARAWRRKRMKSVHRKALSTRANADP